VSCRPSLDFSSCQDGVSRATWSFPERGTSSSEILAGRNYAVGEVVERAYCLVLESQELKGSYMEPYLYPLPDGTGRKLFPLGWGLLYGRCPPEAANIVVEFGREGSGLPQEVQDRAIDADARHWLLFRVRLPIREGEPLLVSSPSKLPHIFSAAVEHFGDECFTVEEWGLSLRKEGAMFADVEQTELLEDTPPEVIELLEESEAPVSVSMSPIHGLGCFAARDIMKGEVVELAPSLPLEAVGIEAGILNSYSFDHAPGIEMLQLGNAAIYNHSDSPNLSHIKFRHTPFLEAWIADRDIAEGEEMFHDYGSDYFSTRGITNRNVDKCSRSQNAKAC